MTLRDDLNEIYKNIPNCRNPNGSLHSVLPHAIEWIEDVKVKLARLDNMIKKYSITESENNEEKKTPQHKRAKTN